MKSMTLNAAVMQFPSARQEAILLKPMGFLHNAGYVWKRVFLKGVRIPTR